ncbi:MAG: hypothetical protein ACR2FN_01405 [Chitinophagaceae bacterium]
MKKIIVMFLLILFVAAGATKFNLNMNIKNHTIIDTMPARTSDSGQNKTQRSNSKKDTASMWHKVDSVKNWPGNKDSLRKNYNDTKPPANNLN